jgi:5,10-methylenetetrahydrofolate reductase
VSTLLETLQSEEPFVAAELRPPRAELASAAGMDAWIDTYHAVRSLTLQGTSVFLTDSAVGVPEEDNLRHLTANIGDDAARDRIVPILTSKHPLEYCLSYADRARQHGFQSLVVLGGDRRIGTPRSVEHAWQLRQAIRRTGSDLVLGGWANPHRSAERQVEYLCDPRFTGEYYLTQIVSHHHVGPVARFLEVADARGVTMPGIFGVFYYRSANPKTLSLLADFITVPAGELTREFAEGTPAEEVCARTLRALKALGVRRFYISNLPLVGTARTLARIRGLAGI